METKSFFQSPLKMWVVGILIVTLIVGGVVWQPDALKKLKGQVTGGTNIAVQTGEGREAIVSYGNKAGSTHTLSMTAETATAGGVKVKIQAVNTAANQDLNQSLGEDRSEIVVYDRSNLNEPSPDYPVSDPFIGSGSNLEIRVTQNEMPAKLLFKVISWKVNDAGDEISGSRKETTIEVDVDLIPLPENGSIQTDLEMSPEGPDDVTFTFDGKAEGQQTFVMDDDGRERDGTDDSTSFSRGYGALPPGATYTITQNAISGFNLTDIDCDASSQTVTLGARKVEIVLGAGEEVKCTFQMQRAVTVETRVEYKGGAAAKYYIFDNLWNPTPFQITAPDGSKITFTVNNNATFMLGVEGACSVEPASAKTQKSTTAEVRLTGGTNCIATVLYYPVVTGAAKIIATPTVNGEQKPAVETTINVEADARGITFPTETPQLEKVSGSGITLTLEGWDAVTGEMKIKLRKETAVNLRSLYFVSPAYAEASDGISGSCYFKGQPERNYEGGYSEHIRSRRISELTYGLIANPACFSQYMFGIFIYAYSSDGTTSSSVEYKVKKPSGGGSGGATPPTTGGERSTANQDPVNLQTTKTYSDATKEIDLLGLIIEASQTKEVQRLSIFIGGSLNLRKIIWDQPKNQNSTIEDSDKKSSYLKIFENILPSANAQPDQFNGPGSKATIKVPGPGNYRIDFKMFFKDGTERTGTLDLKVLPEDVKPLAGTDAILRMFVTSETFTGGQFKTVSFMNQYCAKVAKENNLGGVDWAALVSSKSKDPDPVIAARESKNAEKMLKDSVTYIRVPRTKQPNPKDPKDDDDMLNILGTKSTLLTKGPDRPVLRTEKEGVPYLYFQGNDGLPWTGSDEKGVATGTDCKQWDSGNVSDKGTIGHAHDKTPWLKNKDETCEKKKPLTCVEQLELVPFETSIEIKQPIEVNNPITIISPSGGGTLGGVTFTPGAAPGAGKTPGLYVVEYKKTPTGENIPVEAKAKFVKGFDVKLNNVSTKPGEKACLSFKLYEDEVRPSTIGSNISILHTKNNGETEWLHAVSKGIVTDQRGTYHNMEYCSGKGFSTFSIYIDEPPKTAEPSSAPNTSSSQGGGSSGGGGGGGGAVPFQVAAPGTSQVPGVPGPTIGDVQKAATEQKTAEEVKTSAPKIKFSDISLLSKYKKAIEKVAALGIMTGSPDIKDATKRVFKEKSVINRAELTAILVRWLYPGLHGAPSEKSACFFKDIAKGAWFAETVFIGCEQGLVKGYEDRSFKPSVQMNFVEATKVIVEAAARKSPKNVGKILLKELALSKKTNEAWFQPYIRTAEKTKILGSTDLNLVKKTPTGPATRGWVAQAIANIPEL